MKKILFPLFLALSILGFPHAEDKNVRITNEMIYQKLIDIDKRLTILETQFRDFKEETNKRFEQIDKRFEELRGNMNARFEQIFTFLWIITGIFTTLTLGIIGFAYWDRRTIKYSLKEIRCLE
ncbi:hypothetical protein [Persephonella sp. KM09-Lau-8]|uniref:hypothetical protein n=1 Tax=Persephonella sp. KM09-Lau-8 TaxID=1158345 RepID=UPI00068F1C20|nr:hypothetical protein [Persephonella sp. KM09-Lau-8]